MLFSSPKRWRTSPEKRDAIDLPTRQTPAPEAASEITVAGQDNTSPDKQQEQEQKQNQEQGNPTVPNAHHDDDMVYPTGIRLLLIMLSIFIGMFLVTLVSVSFVAPCIFLPLRNPF